ncbi:sigma 54-interacting transcriptional regulator [Bacillus sp. JJ722]|uniref:sigma 54-interacting transcriptional regulator n=1 Tax=Bacillus sp. JJ722 TaxID=3122973 RepID=UPI003000D28C
MQIKSSFTYTVKDFMTYNVSTLNNTNTLYDALVIFQKDKSKIIPVVNEEEKIIGIMTISTFLNTLKEKVPIDESIMPYIVRPVITVYENDRLYGLKQVFLKHKIGQVIVVSEENHFKGILDSASIINFYRTKSDSLTNSLETLIKYMPTGILALDRNGTIVVSNQAAEQMCNMPSKLIFGSHISEVLPQLKQMLTTVDYRTDASPLLKITLGEKKLLITAKSLTDETQYWGGIILIEDLTNYEQIANELEITKNLERTLKTVVDNAYDGLLLIDKKGKIEMVNTSASEIVNQDENTLIGQPVNDFFPDIKLEEALSMDLQSAKIEAIVVNKRRCLIKKIPIFRQTVAVGALAQIIYKDLSKWKHVISRLDTLEKENSYYRGELSKLGGTPFDLDDILTKNKEMERIKKLARQSSASISNVLILGESGTGKELFARGIHTASHRTGSFIKVNCAAIPSELWESEFFGYDDGAFTGAKRGGKPGKFELANNGTIFLDEIGDMPLSMQVKLLRVLQEREFERVGGTKTIRVNVRVVAATNKDLNQLIANNEFREDLFYRLNVIVINIPPLRKRKEDLPLLTSSITKKFSHLLGLENVKINYTALMLLTSYDWPGNVRELENVIERAMNCINSDIIDVEHLPEHIQRIAQFKSEAKTSSDNSPIEIQLSDQSVLESYKNNLLIAEKEAIINALKQTGGNRTAAAKLLEMSRSQFYQKLKRMN